MIFYLSRDLSRLIPYAPLTLFHTFSLKLHRPIFLHARGGVFSPASAMISRSGLTPPTPPPRGKMGRLNARNIKNSYNSQQRDYSDVGEEEKENIKWGERI
jgi:hypothetical protein